MMLFSNIRFLRIENYFVIVKDSFLVFYFIFILENK